MATKPKPTATAEATSKKRTVRKVTLQEMWNATQVRRENMMRFAHLIIEMENIGREMKVCNDPLHRHEYLHEAQMDENAKARKDAKAKIVQASKVLARYEKERAKRVA